MGLSHKGTNPGCAAARELTSCALNAGDVAGDFFEGDVKSVQLVVAEKAAVGVDHVGLSAGFDGAQEIEVQRSLLPGFITEVVSGVEMDSQKIRFICFC